MTKPWSAGVREKNEDIRFFPARHLKRSPPEVFISSAFRPARLSFFAALFTLLAAGGAFAASAPPSPPGILLMINTSIHDSVSGDPRSYEATVFHRLHQQFPDSRGVVVRGTSNWGVRDELARAMKQLDPSVRIQALVVESHGHSALNGLVSGYHSVAKDASRDFWIDVVQENSVHEIFKDVIGRFASGAKIIFHGCEMMSAGEDQDRIQAMTAIARNFGLQSGYLYLNRNASFEFSDVVIRQPFQDEPELSGKLAHLFLQATAPLSYPGGLIAEKVWNHGYTLEVRVNGPAEEYTLYEDGLFRAETETGPGPDVLRTATLHR